MKDRIHILSYPGPDRSVSEKAIEDKNIIARKYRNRRIGDFLKELNLTEGRNTGIPKIKRVLKNNGSREPDFETNETRDYFFTTIYIHDGFGEKAQVTPQVEDKSIIDFCKEEKSLKEIMGYFGYKDSKNFRETHINSLLKSGKLRQTIPESQLAVNKNILVTCRKLYGKIKNYFR